jgi:hypothetical protein
VNNDDSVCLFIYLFHSFFLYELLPLPLSHAETVQRVLGAALVLARGAERPERAVVLLLLRLLPLTYSSSLFIIASSSASAICFFFFTRFTITMVTIITSTVMRRSVVSVPAVLFIFPLPSAAAVFPHRGRRGSLDAELLAAKRLGH